jgi:hypothetical protein
MRIFFLLLAGLLSTTSIIAQDIAAPIDVFIKQGKDSIHLNNNTVKLKKEPFTLIIVYHVPEKYNGIYVNTSFTKDYYKLEPSETIKDLNYLPQKVYSEHKFNPNKELKVNPEFFQYFGYNPKANWNKFDRIIKTDDKVIAYRKVKNFYLVDEKENIPVEKMRFSIYMIFDIIDQHTGHFFNKELFRTKVKLKF